MIYYHFAELIHRQAEKYGNRLKMNQRIPEVLAGAMGNQMFVALFDTKEEMDLFYKDVLSCRE